MKPTHLWRLPVIAIICFLGLNPLGLMGQGKVDKLIKKADAAFASYNTVDAENYYQQVLQEDPNNFHAAYQLGRVKAFLKDYREALRWYRKATEIDPDRNDTLYLQVGLAYKRLNNYRKAREYFEEFKQRHQTEDEYFERANLELKGVDIAEASLAGRQEYRIKPVNFNSTSSDRFPAYLDQRQEDKFLVFASYRPLPKKKSKRDRVSGEAKDSDLYYVIMENDSVFGEITRFPKKIINTKGNDGPATITGDGLSMYFTICNSKKNKNGCSIFESRYNPVKKQWGKARYIEALSGQREVIVNSRGKTKKVPTDDRQPFITPDGRTLFFVSNRGGGEGGWDLWFSRKVGTGWSEPQNLGANINTPFNEVSPFVNRAGNKLFFASEGHAGFGGLDLYVSEGQIGSWGEPVNMGSPINSSFNDYGSLWLDDDSLVYFTSDRPGGMGRDDIYWGRYVPIDRAKLKVAVKGTIRDKQTKQPIPFATAILYEVLDEATIVSLDTFNTDQDARYEFPLVVDKNYKILGNAPEYLANEEDLSTYEVETDVEFIKNIDIELDPIVIDSAIAIPNIYYDFDEFYLREDALIELAKVVKLLNQNDNITIQLGSHTDSNGTPVYNIGLSNNRARAVVKFLAENGINPGRLTWKGFGETQLMIYPELSDADEQANRRTEFRIMSIEFDQPQP